MPAKILVIEDDIPLTKTLERILIAADYRPMICYTAEDGLRLALLEKPDLVLLDVMIPNMGGWEVCRQVREYSHVPIIFLTALGDAEYIVRGLEIGADDYVVKPFEPSVILARIRAHLRRVSASDQQERFLSFNRGALTIDLVARTVNVQGKAVELTPREFDLLVVLAANAGRVLSTDELVQEAWNMRDLSAGDNIKPYIHYLRKKIEPEPTQPRYLVTVRGVGYRFEDE
jgi:DNA-binding response OmpR family regulator